MKRLAIIFILLIGSMPALKAQLAIGISNSIIWTKGKIVETNASSSFFQSNFSRSNSTTYSLAYYFRRNFKIGFDVQSIKYQLNITSEYGTKVPFRYSSGIYLVPNLNFHYLFRLKPNSKLTFSLGMGAGTFCSSCTKKSEPNYPKKAFTTKSYPDRYLEGIYSNNWESAYPNRRIYTGNLYLGVHYTAWNFHVFSVEGQLSKGNTWSNRHVVRYENNGITPGHDQYENNYAIVEQQHLFWAINLKYELNLNCLPWLWKKVMEQ